MIKKIAYELLCTDNYYNDVCFDYIVEAVENALQDLNTYNVKEINAYIKENLI